MIEIDILNKLNAPTREERLANLKEILKTTEFPPMVPQYINNHIHTTYSFSPYSPTAAVYAARMEGLCTAGIIDHDSISGAREFLAAAELVGMPVTVGMECRVSMDGTAMQGKRTNNPDQVGVSYMTIQSVPHDKIEQLNAWFAPYRAARGRRNRAMVEKINALLDGIALDYDRDVLPLSEAKEDGGVTERHLMYALAKKMVVKAGKGQPMVDYLASIGLNLSEKQKNQMLDTAYPFYEYDLLGILKSAFVPKIYIDATEECPNVRDVAKLCDEIDALLCYAYLGDVTASVTGDKKAQKFEDDYLDERLRHPRRHLYADAQHAGAADETSPSLRRKRSVPGLGRGHQLPAPVVRHQGHGKPAFCQPDRRDLEADRARKDRLCHLLSQNERGMTP